MKVKTISATLLFLLMGCIYASAGEVIVTPMSPGEAAQFFSNVSKIEVGQDYYGNTSLEIYDDQGQVVSSGPVTSRIKITFDGSAREGLSDAVSAEKAISFYPNPAKDFIHIVGVEVPVLAQLYNINGLLILSTQDTNINVSGLPEGQYILQVGKQCYKVLIQ